MIEKDFIKKNVIKENISFVESDIQLRLMSVERYIQCAPDGSFDLVFLDPPFPRHKKKELIEKIGATSLVKEGGLLMIHYPSEDNLDQEKFEAFDLIDRFMGSDVAPVAMEAIIAISLPGEKAPIQNLFRMFFYDDPNDDRIALKRLTVFIDALEEAKRYREAKSTWSSGDQPLSVYYAGEFMTTEMADMEEMDDMLAAIRNEDTYSWYLKKVIYPLIMQKFENCVFNFDDIKHDSWERVWEKLKDVGEVGVDIDITGSGKYSLENEDTIRMIIKDAITQYHSGTLYLYHPMWIFGSRWYWMVLDDYLRMFQQDFELYQMKQLMEHI